MSMDFSKMKASANNVLWAARTVFQRIIALNATSGINFKLITSVRFATKLSIAIIVMMILHLAKSVKRVIS